MQRRYKFYWTRFSSIFINVAAALIFLVGAISAFAYYQSDQTNSFLSFLDLPATVLALSYLVFFISWSIAYSENVVFPDSQYVLIIGVVIGALVIAIMNLTDGNYQNLALPQDWPAFGVSFGVSLIGSALQLYLLVLILRYIQLDDGW